ncbi:MAG: hypothetical protein ACE5RO_05360 [Candidatus Nitrosomaritimum yanchengensis]
MDEKLKIKIEEKIQETLSNKSEIKQLRQYLSNMDDSKSFVLGIIVGRLYNSFYYQTKRILDREPTKEEFNEFVDYLKNRKSDFENLW